MSTDKKEYGLQDLYRDPSEEEDEEDSDFVPEGLAPRMYL